MTVGQDARRAVKQAAGQQSVRYRQQQLIIIWSSWIMMQRLTSSLLKTGGTNFMSVSLRTLGLKGGVISLRSSRSQSMPLPAPSSAAQT